MTAKPRRRSRLLNLSIAAVVFAGVIVGTEFAARRWRDTYAPPKIDQFIASHPAAYQQSPYWSPAFAAEKTVIGPSWHLDADGKWTSNFHGQWHNIDDGIRRTAYQPARAFHTVYVFGSSNLFNAGVPDEDTIPSLLQRRFVAVFGDDYRVVNMGRDAISAAQELETLRTIKLKAGDIVIFYDGRNEIYDNFPYTIARRDQTLTGRICNWLEGPFLDLALTDVFCLWTDKRLPPVYTNDAQWNSWIDHLVTAYQATLVEAHRYVIAAKAQFYTILQPMIWSKPLSPYEQFVISDPYLVEPGLEEAMNRAWPHLQQVPRDLASQGIPSFDFTHILDRARSAGIEMYVDDTHVTERGDAIVAQAMFDAITTF